DETGDGAKETVTDFNFPDADIMDIAKTLGKLTGKNFILDKEVKGRITIISNGPITVGDAWRAFLTALDINNFALIPSGKFIRIAKLNKMLEILDVEGYDAGIEVIPVKYASAAELSKLIDQLLPGTGNAPGGPPGAPRFGGGGSRFNARRTKEGGIINTIIAD